MPITLVNLGSDFVKAATNVLQSLGLRTNQGDEFPVNDFGRRGNSLLMDPQNDSMTSLLTEDERLSEEGLTVNQGATAMLEQDALQQQVIPIFQQPLELGADKQSQLQQVLQTMAQADEKTLTGLQSFMKVEASHYPTDLGTFQTLQLMTMLKQARQVFEEQDLSKASGQASEIATEEAENALFSASLMGLAYSTLRRKKLRSESSEGVDMESGLQEELLDSQLVGCLQDAMTYLTKAQSGLQKAMGQGVYGRRLSSLVHKLLDVYAEIAEMQHELSRQKSSAA